MAYYYLVSQLPNISYSENKSNLPINQESFIEICSRFVSNKEKKIISNLSLIPPKELKSTGSSFLDTWYEKERNLRFALAQIRAQKMKKDAVPLPAGCTQDIITAARTAISMNSPFTAEQFLYEYRLRLIDDIKPLDSFSIDAVYAYGIKLMLIERMHKFNTENGISAYHKIYNSILGDTI